MLPKVRTDETETSLFERAAYLLRSAQRLRTEERAEGQRAISSRRGWPALPDLRPFEALLAVRQGDPSTAATILERACSTPDSPLLHRAVEATVRVEIGEPSGKQELLAVAAKVEEALARPGNPEIVELSYVAPANWCRALSAVLRDDPARRRTRCLLASIHETCGDLPAAIEELRFLATSDDGDAIGSFAASHATRLEGVIARRSK